MKNLIPISALLFCTSFGSNAQPTNGLIAHWNFNGNLNDSHNTHHGIPHNVSTATGKNGLPNTAYYFSDTVSYVTIPYQPDMNLNHLTISAMVKIKTFYTGTCQGNFILTRGQESTNGSYALCAFDNAYNDCTVADTSKYVFYTNINNGGASHTPYQYSPNIVTNTWYCVTSVYNGTELRTYIDGILKSTNYPSGTGIIGSSQNDIILGRYLWLPGYPFQFNGYLDDMKLYNRALADSEIVNYCSSFNGDIGDTTGNDTTNFIAEINTPQINLYPNPNKGNFKIAGSTNSNNSATIQILNAIGQIVYAETATPANNYIDKEINLSGRLSPGIYIFNCKTADFTWTRRLVIKD